MPLEDPGENLKVACTKFSTTEDNSTYKYCISVSYYGNEWEVWRRFSEFDTLLSELDQRSYGCLPELPPKTLFNLKDTNEAKERQRGLQRFVRELVFRPDLRVSEPVRRFLIIHEVPAVDGGGPLEFRPEILRTFEDVRFGVSSIVPIPDLMMVLVLHTDMSNMARLGKIWSIVEPDEMGCLHGWVYEGENGWVRKLYKAFPTKVSHMCWSADLQQIFIAQETGSVAIFRMVQGDATGNEGNWFGNYAMPSANNTGGIKLEKVKDLDLHHQHPITVMNLTRNKLLTCGYDHAVRLVNVNNHEMVSGGRLHRRLEEAEHGKEMYLSAAFYDEENERIFLGTSRYHVFVYHVATNPPQLLHTFAFNVPMQITADGGRSTDVKEKFVSSIIRDENKILIAHGSVIAVFQYFPTKSEHKIFNRQLLELRGTSNYGRSTRIGAMSAASGVAMAGCDNGQMVAWRYDCVTPVFGIQAHDILTSHLAYLDEHHPWGPAVLSGGHDGKVHTWKFDVPDIKNDYKFWIPQKEDVEAKEEPNIIGKTNLEAKHQVVDTNADNIYRDENLMAAKREQQAHLTALTHKGHDDSDSDEDLKGIF